MACSNSVYIPLNKYSKNYQYNVHKATKLLLWSHFDNDRKLRVLSKESNLGFQVPCGTCLSCRIDKLNQLSHRCEYELIKYGAVASFVTFTYDDTHLFNGSYFVDSHTHQVVATLRKDDAHQFLYRLNKLVRSKPNTPFCNHEYKYILVGEYGDGTRRTPNSKGICDRPHFHAIFFGLDYQLCKRLFWRAWNFQGNIQVGPLQNGGIRYLLGYLNNRINGKLAFAKYDYHHLTRPFCWHSVSLGDGLYLSQLEYIDKHYGYYRWHGTDFPVPTYYKNKYLLGSSWTKEGFADKSSRYWKNRKKFEARYGVRFQSGEEFMSFVLEKAAVREENLRLKMVQDGIPFVDYEKLWTEYLMYMDDDFDPDRRLNPYYDEEFYKVITPLGKEIRCQSTILRRKMEYIKMLQSG